MEKIIRDLFLLLMIFLLRGKNRILIFASQRPEIFFSALLIVLAGGGAALFLPTLFNIQVEILEEMFPKISYTFITASLFPFIAWILRQNHGKENSFLILDYMYRGYFTYFKSVFQFAAPAFLSFIFLYLVLSIYSNISIAYSLIFWSVIGLSIMVMSYSIALWVNNMARNWNFLRQSPSLFKTLLVILVLLIMMLPLHKKLGSLWLSEHLPFGSLIIMFALLMGLYIFLISQQIQTANAFDGLQNTHTRFKGWHSIYFFLLLIGSEKIFLFHSLAILFLLILSLITQQYFIMLDLFNIIIIIGSIGLIFHKIEKVANPIFTLRASNFTFSLWLLHFYMLISLLSVFAFYILLSAFSEHSLLFLLKNTDPLVNGAVLYFCNFLSILVAYLFGNYFGPIAQSISSGFILIVSYKLVPEVISRLTMIQNTFLEGALWLFLVAILFLVKWMTIQDYNKNEIAT